MDAGDDKSYDDINVTPMVDLYLVLMLIFIIMTTAGVTGTKVDLPKSSSAPPKLDAPKAKAITINNEGKVFLDTIPVTLQELEAKLREHQAKNPEFPVVIRGDRQVQYQGIMDVLDVCGRLGLEKVGLATVGPK
ncbi:MAG: biopolymer transporter ExbD [Terrimicrobiaceae bacterium]|nr:biopolymer transporter ExbD [Terrimicrobiaceae bacterium]